MTIYGEENEDKRRHISISLKMMTMMLMVMFVNDYDGDCVFAHMRSSIWLFGNDYDDGDSDKGTLATVTVTICSPAFLCQYQ